MATSQPIMAPEATLVDLLDRVLDRGLVIDADIIITLAGIPLVGIKLRAAVAGMETMAQYGLLVDWDKNIRRAASNSHNEPAAAIGRRLFPVSHEDVAKVQF